MFSVNYSRQMHL